MTDPAPEKYLEVSLEIPRLQVDPLSDFICTNLAHGMVIADEDDADLVAITFFLTQPKSDDYLTPLRQFLVDSLGFQQESLPDIREKLVTNIEWVDDYKKSVQPLAITDDIIIRPTWATLSQTVPYEIIMEPRMAFGTGRHETTRSCLKAVRETFTGGRFLDYGCGSGILSILADKMGASYICAIDYDQLAVDNCIENFAINELTTQNSIHLGSLEKADSEKAFDFVAANILKEPILEAMERLLELTAPEGILLLSGFLAEDELDITPALHRFGQRQFELKPDNDWLTYIVRKS